MKIDPRTLFRTVAIAEAVSWAGLLVGMYFKYIASSTQIGVKIFGPIHGVIVLAYLFTVLYVRRSFHWDMRTILLAAFVSVPPFGTLIFEIWADSHGLLRTAGSPREEARAVPVAR